MAHIVIIAHAYDNFRGRNLLIGRLAGHWVDAGHEISLVEGLDDWPDADIAIMQVDLSVIPAAYLQAAKRYRVVINGAATDIRKSKVSRNLLNRGDDWSGPVIVKTDLNFNGLPERQAMEGFHRDGRSPDLVSGPVVSSNRPYSILPSMDEVEEAIWKNPGWVVERFLPERDDQGYYGRIWTFLGDRERCTRYRATHPIVKSATMVAREPVPVPEELRAERERLGFDFGKFDFVFYEGRAILLDANRTPAAPPAIPEVEASNSELARGIDFFVRQLQ